MHNLVAIVLMAFVVLPCNVLAAVKGNRTSVVNMGTKVVSATNNTLVDTECQDSYFGCMDAFCIVENVSGGRCQCSNKHIELSDRLKNIMDLDNQTYAIATYGVEHIELGRAADDVLASSERAFEKAKQDAADDEISDNEKSVATITKKKNLSFSDWNSMFSQNDDEDEEEYIYELDTDDVANKKGDELYKVAMDMCFAQTPTKCKESEDMLKMLYVQKIRSDCAAFENAVNKQESESGFKLEDAKRNVRDAALAELKNSNKYTLGQCALEFKKCMRGENVCGEDWTGCVMLTASENMRNNTAGPAAEQITIEGEFTKIKIAGASMDALLAKKPLCDYVTNQCVKEKDNVWDVFVKDVVAEIKSAELVAESDLRTNCLYSVSQCYLKACKDNMDAEDFDGSYDMCLSRPENYKSFCKVELEPCLVATGGSYDFPEKSSLWRGISAKLASLRVDACTNEFKDCIKDKDRCGSDYSHCIGLDNDDVVALCPEDKLTACYQEYKGNKETVHETLERISQGILLNVDNALFAACEKAVLEAMVRVCGDSENCDSLVDLNGGSHSLKLEWCEYDGKKYFNCKDDQSAITDIELGKTTRDGDLKKQLHERHYFIGKYDGQIYWDFLEIADDSYGFADIDKYERAVKKFADMDNLAKQRVRSELGSLQSSIKNAIDAIEMDPKVQYCMTGRQVEGLKNDEGFVQIIGKAGNGRFPKLTSTYRRIITLSALHRMRENYFRKYEELLERYLSGEMKLAERYATIEDINHKQDLADPARLACIQLGEGDKFGSGYGHGDTHANTKLNSSGGNDGKLVGFRKESSYTYKRQVTTTFSMDSLVCHKCIRTQKCKSVGGARNDYCKKWESEEEECTDIQF